MVSAPLLEVRGLGVSRGKRRLLDGISLTVAPGEILAVVGPNGAGKSTLLKALAGILPYDGDILFEGTPAAALSHRARARRMAYVPQHSALDAALSVTEVVAQGRFAHRDAWGRAHADDSQAVVSALTATDTLRLADRDFTRLSYGERRLVLLARALATDAPILLLDEPTAALDVAHALALLRLLRECAQSGRAVVVALHHLNEVAEFCQRAVLLREGRAFSSGDVREVLAPAPVREVFGVELVPGAHFGYRVPKERAP